MHRIFAGMALWAGLLFSALVILGFLAQKDGSPQQQALLTVHLITGVITAIYVSILHVMVMFHFIGSGKEMKEALEVLGGDAEVIQRLRRLKMQVMPSATFAPMLFGAGVILGGGAHTGTLPGWVHWSLGGAGILLNLYAFPIEYRCLVANLELLREVDEKVRREISPGLFHE